MYEKILENILTIAYYVYIAIMNIKAKEEKGLENMELIDIHSHILPGVDDGAQSIKESLKMLNIAQKNAIGTIILTPHNKPARHNVHTSSMEVRMEQLRKSMETFGIEIHLVGGNELYYRNGIVEEIHSGMARTMADSQYVLVEFGPMESYEYLRNGLYEFLSGGYFPILAHIERYQCLFEQFSKIEELIDMGVYLQVNSGSIMGDFGLKTKRFTRKLLKSKMIHFIATDAHNTENRAPNLKPCAEYVIQKYGKEYAEDVFFKNPKHVLENEII